MWTAEAEAAAARMDVATINVATGLLLPVWNKLPGDDVRVWRISAPGAETVLGRIVDDADLDALGTAMGITVAVTLTAAQLVEAASNRLKPQPIPGHAGLMLASALVNGSRRLELKGYEPARLAWFKSLGCFTEVIAYKTRLFVPTDAAEAVVEKLLPVPTSALAA